MIARLEKLLPRGSFLRNVTILTSGTAFAQALMVLGLPILTRLYPPEAFSMLAVYVGIVSIMTVISSMRYDIAIALPEQEVDGLALLGASLIAAGAVSLLCAIPFILMPNWAAAMLGQPRLQAYFWMIPVGIFVAAAYNAMQYWASRKKRFALVTRTRITRAVGGIGTQLGFGVMSPAPFGLIFGHMIYGGLGMIGLLTNIIRYDRNLLKLVTIQNIFDQARIHRRYPLYSVPEALFGTASSELPLVLIAAFMAGPEAGFIFLAMRVIGLPMGLIGSAVSQVYLSEASQRLREGTLSALTLRTMWVLLKMGAPIMAIIGAVSPLLFPLIFGPEWTRAGWLVAWMTPWFILQFVVGPVSVVMQIKKKFALSLLINIFGLVLRLVCILLAFNFFPDKIGEIFAISGALFCLVYIWVVLRCVGFKIPSIATCMSALGLRKDPL